MRIAAGVLALAGLATAQTHLPGTAPLAGDKDVAVQMVDGIHAWLDRETAAVAGKRVGPPSAERLKRIIGAVDARVPDPQLELITTSAASSVVAQAKTYTVHEVRWPVFAGVWAEGLLFRPAGTPVARAVVLPDADQSPENAPFAHRLAESGCQVLVPVLIDRQDTWSGIPSARMTNQPHREWIYRMAFEVGRHIIGYEVQKTLAAVDWLERENATHRAPVLIAGYGEGGLIALHAAAIDARVSAALVSGYFQPREALWTEPVYRDLWGFLREFGDAEVASLIAPRGLVIDTTAGPVVAGPPRPTDRRRGATPNGTLNGPSPDAVRAEVERARKLNPAARIELTGGEPEAALRALLQLAGVKTGLRAASAVPQIVRSVNAGARMQRQVDQLVSFTQELVRTSPARREQFWAKADASSPERWRESTRWYRDYIHDEVIGRMRAPDVPATPRSRLIFDQPKFRGYEVVLDTWSGIIAAGILLVPKDIAPGEKRPVVVCQHGLEGRPKDLADPAIDHAAYHRFGVRLAEEGFVVYAPQNPYIGQDRFRLIQRKAHPLKLSLFSFIIGQHQRTLEWLGSLPFVDAARIGFYGLSYGGKTAVRVPPLLDGYALSICSADYNEWVWKTTSVDSPYSYMLTNEYDMLEFDFANIVNYSDLANLMAPRPFMVERGHADPVAPDEWVAYEFAKTRRFYATKMKLPDHAQIEFFDGPHTIHGQGTFEFLRKHLRWQRER